MSGTRQCDFEKWAEITLPSNYSIDRLCRDFKVSKRQLFRVFHAFGRTPEKWIHDKRLEHAIDALQTYRSVKRTSIELGYKQPTHFYRDFKRTFSRCPKEFSKPVKGVRLWLSFNPKSGSGTHR